MTDDNRSADDKEARWKEAEGDVTRLCLAPLSFASAKQTPGWEHLRVKDNDTRRILENVTQVDVDAGLAWVLHPGFCRSWPTSGSFSILCCLHSRERYREEWKKWR